jgi:hypothetical protein
MVGLYQVYKGDILEFSLYALAGLTFIVNALAGEPTLTAYKKPLVIASWFFIIVTAITFLYLIQFKFS